MTKEEYIIQMKKHQNEFDHLWIKIVDDTNQFIKDNPDIRFDSFQNSVEHFTDILCLSGAWVQDRINNKCGLPNTNEYKGSLSKKIRKTLGYNL